MDGIDNRDRLIMIFVTCGSEEEAACLSQGLIGDHLAACVNIAAIHSVFEWQGKIENQAEWLLVIKSLNSRFSDIEQYVKNNHSYDLPEIIAIDIAESSAEYAGWVKSICK
jgi:periplasmic divalent cation tolerance protein